MRAKPFIIAALFAALVVPSALVAVDHAKSVKSLGDAKTRTERNNIVKDLREQGEDAREALKEGLKSESAIVRAESLRLLSELKNSADLSDILKHLGADELSLEVRCAAANATKLFPDEATKVREHLLGRFNTKDLSQSETVAILSAMRSVADASLLAPINEKLVPGVSSGVALGLVDVLAAVPDRAGNPNLISFLEKKAKKKVEEDKESEDDKPGEEKPVEGEKPVVVDTSKWAFEPVSNIAVTVKENDIQAWQAVRARAILALAQSADPAGVKYVVEGLDSNEPFNGSASDKVLREMANNYPSETIVPELIKILEDATKTSDYPRVSKLLAGFGSVALDAVFVLVDASIETQQTELKKLIAEGNKDAKVANQFENTFRTIADAFGRDKQGRAALADAYPIRISKEIEGDIAAKYMLKALLPTDREFDIRDDAGARAVLFALDSSDRTVVDLGMSKWSHFRGKRDAVLMVKHVLANQSEDVLNNDATYKKAFDQFRMMMERGQDNRIQNPELIAFLKNSSDVEFETRPKVRAEAWNCFVRLEEPGLFEHFSKGFADPDPTVAFAAGKAFGTYASNMALSDKRRADMQKVAIETFFAGMKPVDDAAAHGGAARGLMETFQAAISGVFGKFDKNNPKQASLLKLAQDNIDSDKPYLQRAAMVLRPQFRSDDFNERVIEVFKTSENPFVVEKTTSIISESLKAGKIETAEQQEILKRAFHWVKVGTKAVAKDHGMIDNLESQTRVIQELSNLFYTLGSKTSGTLITATASALIEAVEEAKTTLEGAGSPAEAKETINLLVNMAVVEQRLQGEDRLEAYLAALEAIDEEKHIEKGSNTIGSLADTFQKYFAAAASESHLERIEAIPFMKGRMKFIRRQVDSRAKAKAAAEARDAAK